MTGRCFLLKKSFRGCISLWEGPSLLQSPLAKDRTWFWELRQKGPARIAGVLGNWAFKIRKFTDAEQSLAVATRAKSLPALPGRKLYIVLPEQSDLKSLIALFHSMESNLMFRLFR